MHVAVGSENPVKVTATERALRGRIDATVLSVGVDSGVPEQPRGHEQTLAGARTRARAALSRTDAALGVGIEGGVAGFDGVTGSHLVMWAVVTDGERTGEGGGPSVPLPEGIAARVRDGETLGPVLDDLLGTEGVGRDQGAAGVLTDGIVDRESCLVHAVAGALGPFVTDFY